MNFSQRIIFMGTPGLAVPYLKSLLENNFNVVAVYTQPPRPRDRGMEIKPSPIQVFAEINQIPLNIPSSLNSSEEINKFKHLKSDLVVVMGYGIFLPKSFLEVPIFGCINVHLSLLPKWRGASPVEYSLLSGESETGVTIFKLNNKLDSGPIITSKKCEITDSITKIQLQEKLNNIGSKLLIETLPYYFSEKFELQSQDNSKATYASKINSSDTKINFYYNSLEVYNKIRAFSPKPGAWFTYKNERIKILSCSIESNKGTSSVILSKDFIIGCNDQSIKPIIVQREGKNIMNIEEFLKGFSFNVGEKVNLNA